MSDSLHLARALQRLVTDPHNGWLCPFSEAVSGVTAEQAAWVPAPGLNAIWALVHHIRVEAEVVQRRLLGEPADYAALGAPDGWPESGMTVDEAAWQEACRSAVAAHEELAALLETLSDEELAQPVKPGWPSRRYWVQGLIAHTLYHTGQIVLLRRLQGNWEPLQWLPEGS
ncbi:MAG: DinB family protein [Bacillota bacterium]